MFELLFWFTLSTRPAGHLSAAAEPVAAVFPLRARGPNEPEPEKGEVLLRGICTLRYLLILSENSACQVPICAVAV